jgi:hypothetical protein
VILAANFVIAGDKVVLLASLTRYHSEIQATSLLNVAYMPGFLRSYRKRKRIPSAG